ncbi:MAG: translation initiation factor IF-2, partial [Terriglobales bacterium]
AQPDRVKKQLGDRGLLAEDWGGTTVMVNVSARAKTNLNLLLEMILLVSDLQDLKADPDLPAQGVVLEAELDRGRGPVARMLVQSGTVHAGDTVIAGSVFGRVRAMFDDRGRTLESAGPSTPVELLGLDGLPEAGDSWLVVNDRAKARQIVQFREDKAREAAMTRSAHLNLEALSQQLARGDVKELNLIVKADVQGSEEVLVDSLNKLSTDKVKLRVIHSGVGAITETDVLLASASSAVVIGFNVRPERKAADLAEQEKVDVRLHSIIYELTDEIKKAMHGLLEPTFKEVILGRAEVQQTFRIPKAGTIAGCLVKEGKLVRDGQVRVVRDGAVVYTSKLTSLRRFKDDASEVRAGMECGAGVANFSDIKPGDTIEAFAMEKVAPLMA